MDSRWNQRDLKRKIGRDACAPPHLKTGKQGEQIAQKYLVSIGYELRDINIRINRDEIDIIAFDPIDSVLVFVEVKTRSSISDNIDPSINMTMNKKRKVCRSARHWICNHQYDGGYRIDIIYIAARKVIRHVKEMEWID